MRELACGREGAACLENYRRVGIISVEGTPCDAAEQMVKMHFIILCGLDDIV